MDETNVGQDPKTAGSRDEDESSSGSEADETPASTATTQPVVADPTPVQAQTPTEEPATEQD